MKTLKKSLDILEFVSLHGGHPVTPSEAAEEFGINLSSCVRMMQTLVERGYLTQLSRRSGYVTGPATAVYSCRSSIYNFLVDSAREPLKELSREIHALVNLSVIHGDTRYAIYHCGYTPRIQLTNFIAQPRPWNYHENATERLLIAAAGKTERKKIIEKIGLPEPFKTIEELHAEMDRLRKVGTVKFYSDRQQLWIGGGLTEMRKFPAAAIGFGVPTEKDADFAVEAVSRCCAKIKSNLELQNTFL